MTRRAVPWLTCSRTAGLFYGIKKLFVWRNAVWVQHAVWDSLRARQEGCRCKSSNRNWRLRLSTSLTLTHSGRAPSQWWGSPHVEPRPGRQSRGAAEAPDWFRPFLLPLNLMKPHGNPGGIVQYQDNWDIIQTLGFNERKIHFTWLLPKVDLLYIFFYLFVLHNTTYFCELQESGRAQNKYQKRRSITVNAVILLCLRTFQTCYIHEIKTCLHWRGGELVIDQWTGEMFCCQFRTRRQHLKDHISVRWNIPARPIKKMSYKCIKTPHTPRVTCCPGCTLMPNDVCVYRFTQGDGSLTKKFSSRRFSHPWVSLLVPH